jgi:hypothetical protein
VRDPVFISAHVDHEEGASMAVKVVAAIDGAEHRRIVWDGYPVRERRVGQFPLAAANGVPHNEVQGFAVRADRIQEDTAVARVENEEIAVVGVNGEEGGGGGQGSEPAEYRIVVLEESQQGRRPVELAVEAGEGGAGEAAAPGLADERGAEEAAGIFWREAEEDLLEELVRQRRRRRHGRWSPGLGRKRRSNCWGNGLL